MFKKGYLLITIPHLVPVSKRNIAIVITFPILLSLFLALPCFDCGSKQDDYYAAPGTFLFLSFYLENVLFPPQDGLRFIGRNQDLEGVGLAGCPTLWYVDGICCFPSVGADSAVGRARLKWTFKLQPNTRGVGWNWQVKNVPRIVDAELPKWRSVSKRLTVAAYYFGEKFLPCSVYQHQSPVFQLR